ncbi:hypothetical protein NIK97_06675 [Brucella pseudintermedia]|uniref:Uncharacterized protein n=1 Tax=Brucella pseudintermedia TaxID=370111 RepID=A0ABY5UB27_9HYPH|nr:hypothetical protein [Brucella pseudintermedia]UWL59234.1 hypothetical protein NIK97_06675 [Brucella pseudintermedia]
MTDHKLRQRLIRRSARLLMPDVACAVDEPLRAAIDAGILVGGEQAHREALAAVVAEAWGEALVAKAERQAREAAKARQASARKLAKALDALVLDLADEADALAALLEATETTDAETDDEIAERRRQADLLSQAAKEARRIAAESGSAPKAGNRTDHLLRGYFAAFAAWWADNVRPTNADAVKARDLVTEALAFDLGLIPDGYPLGAFARYGFKKI